MTAPSLEPGTTEWAIRLLELIQEHGHRAKEHDSWVGVCQLCGRLEPCVGVIGAMARTRNPAGYQCGRHGDQAAVHQAALASLDRFCPVCAQNVGPSPRGGRMCDACAPVFGGQDASVLQTLRELRGLAAQGRAPAFLLGHVSHVERESDR